jgi:hypothetical protein
MHQPVENPARRPGFHGDGIGSAYLPEYLRFTNYHRVERGGDAEKVTHRLIVGVAIKMILQKTGGKISLTVQKVGHSLRT